MKRPFSFCVDFYFATYHSVVAVHIDLVEDFDVSDNAGFVHQDIVNFIEIFEMGLCQVHLFVGISF